MDSAHFYSVAEYEEELTRDRTLYGVNMTPESLHRRER